MIPGRFAMACALAASAAGACAPVRPAVPMPPAGRELVVLVPDPGGDGVGRAIVSTHGTSLALDRAATAVEVQGGRAAARTLDPADIATRFGGVLAAVPAPAAYFDLYFETGDTELTAASQAMLPAILAAVRGRPFPDVSVVGHTDAVGRAADNVQLGLRRARVVARLLRDAGVAAIDVASHGERDPLVPTRDGASEPRNRRAQVIIR